MHAHTTSTYCPVLSWIFFPIFVDHRIPSFLFGLLTFAHLCRSYPCPGSIAMTVFLHASLSCASLGSSWWCLKSLCTRSIHLSLGLPRGLFPPTVIVVTCFATFVSSLLNTWPHQERRFWVTCGDWLDHCIAPELFISDSVFPGFALNPS